MKKIFLSVNLLLATFFLTSAQVTIPTNGQIHNTCLTQSMENFNAFASFDEIAAFSFSCLENQGISLDDESRNKIKEVFNLFDANQPLYSQLLNKYNSEKSNLTDAYNSAFGMILNQLDSLKQHFDLSAEEFNNIAVNNFEDVRTTINNFESLSEVEKDQLSITLDVAIGSTIFWHEKYKEKEEPASSEAKKWWENPIITKAVSFAGSDIVGAGAVMQITYGTMPAPAYLAAGLCASAWTALHW